MKAKLGSGPRAVPPLRRKDDSCQQDFEWQSAQEGVLGSSAPANRPSPFRVFFQVAFFLYNGVSLDQFVLQVTHPRYLKNSLVYHPRLRAQAWRYLTYIFMHAG